MTQQNKVAHEAENLHFAFLRHSASLFATIKGVKTCPTTTIHAS